MSRLSTPESARVGRKAEHEVLKSFAYNLMANHAECAVVSVSHPLVRCLQIR